jgi:hypothetical protein
MPLSSPRNGKRDRANRELEDIWRRGLSTREFKQSCLKRVPAPCTGFMRQENRPSAAYKYQPCAFPAILRQLSAQSRHAIAHFSMLPMFSQLSAHASQISTQTREICSLKLEPLNMNLMRSGIFRRNLSLGVNARARRAHRPIPGNKSLPSANRSDGSYCTVNA